MLLPVMLLPLLILMPLLLLLSLMVLMLLPLLSLRWSRLLCGSRRASLRASFPPPTLPSVLPPTPTSPIPLVDRDVRL